AHTLSARKKFLLWRNISRHRNCSPHILPASVSPGCMPDVLYKSEPPHLLLLPPEDSPASRPAPPLYLYHSSVLLSLLHPRHPSFEPKVLLRSQLQKVPRQAEASISFCLFSGFTDHLSIRNLDSAIGDIINRFRHNDPFCFFHDSSLQNLRRIPFLHVHGFLIND